MTKAMEQEKELEAAQQELDMQRQQEERMKARLKEQEEEIADLDERVLSQDEHLEKLTAKLESLWKKFQTVKAEVEDIQQENQQERNDMVDAVRDLTKDLRLKVAIISRFMPISEYKKIEERSSYDEHSDEWHIPKQMLAGNMIRSKRPASAAGVRRPADGARDGREDRAEDDGPANVYYTYTTDGAVRAETQPRRRCRSAKRPGTASRKGRSLRPSQDQRDDGADEFNPLGVDGREEGRSRKWG